MHYFRELSKFFLSRLEETPADETSEAISRKGMAQKFEFFNFKEDKFSFLNTTAMVKRVAEVRQFVMRVLLIGHCASVALFFQRIKPP